MAKSILVVCPNLAFGELLRISLEESAQFNVRLVQTGSEALSANSRASFDLILLDAEVRDQHFALLAQLLQEKRPETRFILIPPQNNPDHPALSGLRIHGTLNKPFYAPELIEQITAALVPAAEPLPSAAAEPPTTPREDPSGEPIWRRKPGLAAERLEKTVAQTNALAALVCVRGTLFAAAGGLPETTARELASALQRALDGQDSGDMMRYIRLETAGHDALLYARRLDAHSTLVLYFNAALPVSRARHYTRSAALELIREDEPEHLPERVAMPPVEELENPGAGVSDFEFEELEEVQEINLASILSHIPPPNPTPNPAETSEWTASDENSFLFPWERGNPPVEQAGSTQPVKTRKTPGGVEDTAPRPGTGVDAAQTAYTCVLLPRLPQHTLNGTLSRLISDWLPELCLSYGWRLERSDLQPEYLQWTLRVAPAVSPGNTVRILRRALSERIFESHPELRPLDLREDFWAAGYLILSGSAAPAPAALQDFILKTRRRQGYPQP